MVTKLTHDKQELMKRIKYLENQPLQSLSCNECMNSDHWLPKQDGKQSDSHESSQHSLQEDYEEMLEERICALENEKNELMKVHTHDKKLKERIATLIDEKQILEDRIRDLKIPQQFQITVQCSDEKCHEKMSQLMEEKEKSENKIITLQNEQTKIGKRTV